MKLRNSYLDALPSERRISALTHGGWHLPLEQDNITGNWVHFWYSSNKNGCKKFKHRSIGYGKHRNWRVVCKLIRHQSSK